MKTIKTIAEQKEWIDNHATTLTHKWSTNGMGNSKILNGHSSEVIGKADGCGYDRYGAALGEAIITLFPEELHKLAKRHCKGKRRNYKQPKNQRLYGLFYNSITGKVWVDGGCGSNQMVNILNAIGFGLDYVGECDKGRTGETFYTLRPASRQEKRWLLEY